MAQPRKILLPVDEFPKGWYNIVPDLAKTGKKLSEPKDSDRVGRMKEYMAPSLLAQEKTGAGEVPIPEEVRSNLIRVGRPTPLQHANRLEAYLKTPAKIYYKREDIVYSTTSKTNTAIPQAYYIANDGFENVAGGGGAQWGSALSIAACYYKLKCDFVVPQSYLELKSPHRILMEVNKVNIIGSPSDATEVGKKVKGEKKYETGNVSLSISEAIEKAMGEKNAAFSFGNFFNFTLLHQTISGVEAKKQFELVDKYPDVVVTSIDDFGFALPFIADKLNGKKPDMKIVVAQSDYVPVLTEGKLGFDYADYAGLTPQYRFHSLGHTFDPPMIHAGEMRYHGAPPILSHLVEAGLVEVKSYKQTECFKTGMEWARIQGVIPSHETQYAVKAAMDEALEAKEKGEEKVIVFNSAGHTMLESAGYLEIIMDKKLKLP
jgi:tryptophan synthase beta chain